VGEFDSVVVEGWAGSDARTVEEVFSVLINLRSKFVGLTLQIEAEDFEST
jgi:hypothetical protein